MDDKKKRERFRAISSDNASLPVDTRREFVFVSDTGRQGGISGTGVPKS